MFRYFFAAAVLLSSGATARDMCDASAAAAKTTSRAVSADGATRALVSQKPACLTIIRGKTSRSIFLPDVDKVTDIGPDPQVSLSPSGDFVAMQFEAGEDDHVVMVFKANNLRRVLAEKATSATWDTSHDELFIVPLYGMMDAQTTKGLVLFSARTRRKSLIATEFYFRGAGPGETRLHARQVDAPGREIIYDLVTRKPIF